MNYKASTGPRFRIFHITVILFLGSSLFREVSLGKKEECKRCYTHFLICECLLLFVASSVPVNLIYRICYHCIQFVIAVYTYHTQVNIYGGLVTYLKYH